MTELTLDEMEEILHKHEEFELAYDLDGTISTLTANPQYELPALGWRIEGRDAVTETYRRLLPMAEKTAMWAEKRVHAVAPNTLCREAYVMFNTADGERVTGQYMVVIAFEGHLIAGERMYMDTSFAKVMAEALGADFGEIPGVSRLVSTESSLV
jgi:hypothetical protein